MQTTWVIASLLNAGLLFVAAPADADGFIVPSVGVNFGGDSGATLIDATQNSTQNSSRVSYGVAAGMMTNGIFGFEEDFAWAPNFFGDGGGINETRVMTLMTNVLIGIPVGGQQGPGIRPYAAAGLGLIHRRVDSSVSLTDFSANDFGYDLGAGVMGYFANHVGMRAGVQYFRNFEHTGSNVIGLDAGQFNFFRGSVGVLFRF